MGAASFEDQIVAFDAIDEQPVKRDVTFAVSVPAAGERVVPIPDRQQGPTRQRLNDGPPIAEVLERPCERLPASGPRPAGA